MNTILFEASARGPAHLASHAVVRYPTISVSTASPSYSKPRLVWSAALRLEARPVGAKLLDLSARISSGYFRRRQILAQHAGRKPAYARPSHANLNRRSPRSCAHCDFEPAHCLTFAFATTSLVHTLLRFRKTPARCPSQNVQLIPESHCCNGRLLLVTFMKIQALGLLPCQQCVAHDICGGDTHCGFRICSSTRAALAINSLIMSSWDIFPHP